MTTTPLDEITGNPDRSIAILALVHEAAAEGKLTLDNVGSKTHRFDNARGVFGPVGEDEYSAAVAMVRPAEFSAVEPATVGDDIAEALHTPVAEAEPVEQPTMTREEAMAELNARNNDLHVARLDKTKADEAVRRSREALSKSLTAWQSGGPTEDQIRRRELAAINADRAARAAQGPVRRGRVLRSVIDAQAYYRTQGDAADYARKQHQFGSHHRPARISADPNDGTLLQRPGKRDLIASKVPSEH
jgi:hypothetical protein